MAALNPPSSSAVVEVSDDLVERYEAAGWKRVESESGGGGEKPKPRRKRS